MQTLTFATRHQATFLLGMHQCVKKKSHLKFHLILFLYSIQLDKESTKLMFI